MFTNEQALSVDQSLQLGKDAAKHITRVLRRKVDDEVVVFNGDGNDYPATLIQTTPHAVLRITGKIDNQNESPLAVTLVQSLAKGTKLDLVIQKATELGVNRIVPVIAARSVMQIDEKRLERRMQHWKAVAVSACTQCQRSKLPIIEQPQPLNRWLPANAAGSMLLHPEASVAISSITVTANHCQLLVGPEGGFTDDELQLATHHRIPLVSCGPRVLRTETAGFTALSVLQSRYGDL